MNPTGTFFDGQTPPLHAQAALPAGATSATIELQIKDAGNGIFDSAAFLTNLSFTQPTQVVYLEFDAAAIGPQGHFVKPMQKSAYSISSADKTSIETQLDNLYKDFLVYFTLTKPTSGKYSTLYIGEISNIPAYYDNKSNVLGWTYLDPGNK